MGGDIEDLVDRLECRYVRVCLLSNREECARTAVCVVGLSQLLPDWQLAVEHGSTNVRIGSAIFGARNYASTEDHTPAVATLCEGPTI